MAQQLNEVKCPKCSHLFSVTAAIAGEIAREAEAKAKAREAQLEAEIKKQRDLLTKEKELIEKQKEEVADLVAKRLTQEKAALEAKVKAQLQTQSQVEMQDLKAQLSERQKQLEEAAKHELELRAKTRELEEREKRQALELQRKLDAEKTAMEEALRTSMTEEFQLKSAEKDLKLEGMKKQIEELRRKAEQGSQQTQGEVLELEIEKNLASMFPSDNLVPVAKGQKGGDVLHEILHRSGQVAGRILYEIKNTKNWSDTWIEKAKSDQREAKAEFIVIVTAALPKGMNRFGQVDGVWVTDFGCYPALSQALRFHVREISSARAAALNKGEKKDVVYEYLTGTEFRQRIESMVEAVIKMQNGMEDEKRLITKMQASRTKCIEQLLVGVTGIYGDLQGMIGNHLPKISSLEIEGTALLPESQG